MMHDETLIMDKNTQPHSIPLKSVVSLLATSGIFIGPQASGGIVTSETVPDGGLRPNNNWDVDNDGTLDFSLELYNKYGDGRFYFDDLNGGRIFGRTTVGNDRFDKLNAGQVVGSGVAGFGFLGNAQGTVTVAANNNIGNDAAVGGWEMGDTGYLGYKFTSGVNTHYGWLSLTIDTNTTDKGFKINEAYFESTPGQSITVGAVPEPAQTALGLGALALGAAGLRRWRNAKAAKAN